jgi:uncharacterized protein YrrD
MIGYTIHATDGNLGKVHEFYFDDLTWTIRFMVAETGIWLLGRKILISPIALGKPDWALQTFSVNLTCDQVRGSPDIDTEKPVYRQHEAALYDYYQWPPYWQGGFASGFGAAPYPLFGYAMPQISPELKEQGDPHLRSTRQVTGYKIHASDGEIGHVEDFMIDDENWSIPSLIVDTGKWLSGRKVLIAPNWIKSLNWAEKSVFLDQTRESVKNSPDYDPLKNV